MHGLEAEDIGRAIDRADVVRVFQIVEHQLKMLRAVLNFFDEQSPFVRGDAIEKEC